MAKKILVVDDDRSLVKIVESKLQGAGYEVITAHDCVTGLQRVAEETPDLVVLDIMMPGMDGTRMGEIMHNDRMTRRIPIIFLSAILTKEEAALTGHVLANDLILAKPFDGDELLAMIQNVFQDRE